jgi:hypothetical protein
VYVRNDTAGAGTPAARIRWGDDLYAHYEDIEAPYREQVFKLGV